MKHWKNHCVPYRHEVKRLHFRKANKAKQSQFDLFGSIFKLKRRKTGYFTRLFRDFNKLKK